MDEGVSPTLRQWQLAEFLRDKREQKTWTMEDATERLKPTGKRWSRSKVQRIEHRLYVPKPSEVEQIASAYELTDTESTELLHMCQEARRKGWWQSSALPTSFHTMAGLERAATVIRDFEQSLVPGLLQTSAYARALMAAIEPLESPEILESMIAARLTRQHILNRDNPPQLHAIITEAVLRWTVGGQRVMNEQLQHLIDRSGDKNITIQVLPFDTGPNVGMEGAFRVISLPQLSNDIGYAEIATGGIYIELRDDVRRCVMRFATLSNQALSPAASVKFLRSILAEYT